MASRAKKRSRRKAIGHWVLDIGHCKPEEIAFSPGMTMANTQYPIPNGATFQLFEAYGRRLRLEQNAVGRADRSARLAVAAAKSEEAQSGDRRHRLWRHSRAASERLPPRRVPGDGALRPHRKQGPRLSGEVLSRRDGHDRLPRVVEERRCRGR